jgi:hypothetical protein
VDVSEEVVQLFARLECVLDSNFGTSTVLIKLALKGPAKLALKGPKISA